MTEEVKETTALEKFPLGKGLLIAVEGVDCAGKDEVCRILERLLGEFRLPAKVVADLNSTRTGKMVREMYLDPDATDHPTPNAELLAIFAARSDNLAKNILPSLNPHPHPDNAIVIANRYNDSTFVYQVIKKAADPDLYNYLAASVTSVFAQPMLTIMVKSDLEKCYERMVNKPNRDLHEKKDMEYFRQIQEAYRVKEEAQPFSYFTVENNGTLEDLELQVKKVVNILINFFMRNGGYVSKAFFDFIVNRDVEALTNRAAEQADALQEAADQAASQANLDFSADAPTETVTEVPVV